MQLDRHISTHIRESPQAMHRTKLKDLATQTYIRWQDLLAHCQPQVVSYNPLDLGGKGSGQSVGLGISSRPSTPAAAAGLQRERVEWAVWWRVGMSQGTFVLNPGPGEGMQKGTQGACL